jgi:hypothetical protein
MQLRWIGLIDDSRAKPRSKWSPDEDEEIIKLRGRGMKWEDISKQLPGRSVDASRLRYQNYLERRSEWDEDRKNKLARLYERYVEKHSTRSFESCITKGLTQIPADSKQICGPRLQRK